MPNEETEETHDNAGGLRWLLTYADMITLLMALFVILYAISTTNTRKFNAFVSEVKAGFSLFPDTTYHGKGKQTPVLRSRESMDTLDSDLAGDLKKEMADGKVKIRQGPDGITISIEDEALFLPGQADMTPQSLEMLGRLASRLAGMSNEVIVEGYTDNRPIHTSRFPSNWELSTGRAVNVVKYLAEAGISPTRLSAIGYGEFRPLVPNDPVHGTPANRRIDVVVKRMAPEPVIQRIGKPTLSGADFVPPVPPAR